MDKEVIYLVGDFQSDVLKRWAKFAKLTNRDIKHISFEGIPPTLYGHRSPILIMDDHGFNDLHLPGDTL